MISRYLQTALALSPLALLSACGSGGVNSTASISPPPPARPISVVSTAIIGRTPLPQTIATTAGTYGGVAVLYDTAFDEKGAQGPTTVSPLDPSSVRITVDPPGNAFTLKAQLANGTIERKYVGSSDDTLHSSIATNSFYGDFGYNIQYQYTFSDGSKSEVHNLDVDQFSGVIEHSPAVSSNGTGQSQNAPDRFETSSFFTETGLRYVSYGEWYMADMEVDGPFAPTRQTGSRSVRFVYGERTAPSDLPVSGKASYEDDYGALNFRKGVLHLAADFGQRTIAANLDYPADILLETDDNGNTTKTAIVGIKASGSSSISAAADFVIPLTGNAIYPDVEGKRPDILDPVTGTFTGAFFGPQAAEAGGFVTLNSIGDSVWSSMPFLLERK